MNPSSHMAMLVQGDWGAGTWLPSDWVASVGLVGAALAALAFAWLLLRGILQSSRYSATAVLGETERAELAAGIERAERRTLGDIAVVVLERSDRHPGAEWLAASLALMLGSVLLSGWLPWDRPALFFACQAGLGAAGFLAARTVPGFKRVFVSELRATEMAGEQAFQEFFALGLQNTSEDTGVLLFVSLLERRVIVMGDRGIDQRVDAEEWQATSRAVLDGIRAGSLRRGLDAGLERVADVLAKHFPADGERPGELPNHVIVRGE